MSIYVTWDNSEQSCLRWDFDGFWNWNEVYEATLRSVEMRKSLKHRGDVSVILNMENASTIPMTELKKAHDALMLRPDGRDLVVVVGQNIFIHTLVDIFRRRYLDIADQFIGVDTLKDARRIIRIHKTGHP